MTTSTKGRAKGDHQGHRWSRRRISSSVPPGATVTQCSTADILELVSSAYPEEKEGEEEDYSSEHPTPNQNMKGFDVTFVDIVDYILRVTQWIWNTKNNKKDDNSKNMIQQSSSSSSSSLSSSPPSSSALSAKILDFSHVSKLCDRYYSKDCTLHMLSEDFVGRRSIIDEFEECKFDFQPNVRIEQQITHSVGTL